MTCKVTKNNKTQIHHNNHEKWQDFEDEAWQHLSRARKNNQGLIDRLQKTTLL
jgi:hypothetical protein